MYMRNLFLLALLVPTSVFSQSVSVSKYSTPLDGIVIMREVEDKYNTAVYNLEAPIPDGNIDKLKLIAAKQIVGDLFPRTVNRSSGKSSTGNIEVPVVEDNFITDSVSGIPPDNDMAISVSGMAVSVVNSYISVID